MVKMPKVKQVAWRGDDGPQAEELPSVAPQLLSIHGERFMSMFDDYDEEAEAQRQRRQSNKAAGARKYPQVSHELPQQPQQHKGEDGGNYVVQTASGKQGQDGPAASRGQCKKGRPSPKDEIEEIIFYDKHKPHGMTVASATGMNQNDQASIDVDMERRLFMSSKASKIHQSVGNQMYGSHTVEEEDVDPELTPEEFKRLQLEVERLGATALDKRERKKWQAAMLQRLGAKPDKNPRVPAAIGIGMAKKQAQREAKKLEEAFETGMAQRKGMGKKKRAAQSKNRDWGLQELGRGFKGGVLRIKSNKGKTGFKDAGPVRKMGGKGGKKGKKNMKMPL